MATVLHSGSNVDDATFEKMEQLWGRGYRRREQRRLKRRTPPRIRLWDGNWRYVGQVAASIEGKTQWKMNDTGVGFIRIPIDSFLAKWALNIYDRDTKNIHITVDKDGTRWDGRIKDLSLHKEKDGQRFVDLVFLHSYEELKHVYCYPNPFLPPGVQFPRSFMLAGPTAWILKCALAFNLARLQGRRGRIGNDPLAGGGWLGENANGQPIMVKPGAMSEDTSPWGVISSRMKNWHDLAAPKLSDAQLSVECWRWLDGDPLPWPGANVRHGTLIVDIVNKSGFWDERGTVTRGSLRGGLLRSRHRVTADHMETQYNTLAADPNAQEANNFYSRPGKLGTARNAPYVIYRDGDLTGVESANFSWSPATDVTMVTGGHSMPGVNEGISAAIQLVGNYLGLLVLVPGAGKIADTFLAPLYTDTILAWMTRTSAERQRSLGWSHYYEHFCEGADRAYTVSAIVALRKGFWETREKYSHKIKVKDGAPWFVGMGDEGHFFLGDRIGATIKGLPGKTVVVEQVTELTFAWSRDEFGWDIVCGDPQQQQSPLERALGKIKEVTAGLHDVGLI